MYNVYEYFLTCENYTKVFLARNIEIKTCEMSL